MVPTRGWVLPGDPAAAPRYAVCWNGLIYPVLAIGARADLHADAMSLSPPSSRRFNRS